MIRRAPAFPGLPGAAFRPPRGLCVVLLAAWLALAPATAPACTLWAATGEAASDGGTILVKNRDFFPYPVGSLAVKRPASGHAFLGLFVPIDGHRNLVAGVNQAGLAVVSATAGSIPREKRRVPSAIRNLTEKMLTELTSVDEVLAHRDWLASRSPVIYMVADAQCAAWIEIGLRGVVAWRKADRGTLAHSNHFLAPELWEQNEKIGPSSARRIERIEYLLAEAKRPLTVQALRRMSADELGGPDDSIFRRGSGPKSGRTLAAIFVRIPPQGPVAFSMRGFEQEAPVWTYDAVLDQAFWDQVTPGQSRTVAPARP